MEATASSRPATSKWRLTFKHGQICQAYGPGDVLATQACIGEDALELLLGIDTLLDLFVNSSGQAHQKPAIDRGAKVSLSHVSCGGWDMGSNVLVGIMTMNTRMLYQVGATTLP